MTLTLTEFEQDTRAITSIHAEQINVPHTAYQIQAVNIESFADYVFASKNSHYEFAGETHIYLVRSHGGVSLTRQQALSLALFVHSNPVPFLLNPTKMTLHNSTKETG